VTNELCTDTSGWRCHRPCTLAAETVVCQCVSSVYHCVLHLAKTYSMTTVFYINLEIMTCKILMDL